jgi:CheY-like chemotaxis protein
MPNPLVLLVEDEDEVRRSLQLLLRSHSYDVISHSSAVGLAQDVKARAASCLIADLVMPGIDAFELLAQMRGSGWAGKSILISGYPIEDWRDRANDAGFDATLAKPIGPSILLRTIEGLLTKRPSHEG